MQEDDEARVSRWKFQDKVIRMYLDKACDEFTRSLLNQDKFLAKLQALVDASGLPSPFWTNQECQDAAPEVARLINEWLEFIKNRQLAIDLEYFRMTDINPRVSMPACIEKLSKIFKTLPAVPKEALEESVIEAFVLKRIKQRLTAKQHTNFLIGSDGVKRKEIDITKVNSFREHYRKPINKWKNLFTHKLKPKEDVKVSRLYDLKTIMDSRQRIFKKFERAPI